MRENRETPQVSAWQQPAGAAGEGDELDGQPVPSGESDERVVPAKYPHKGAVRPAEGMEGSRSTQGNAEENHTLRSQSRDKRVPGTPTCAESSPRFCHSELGTRFAANTRGRSRMHYVASRIMWRPASNAFVLIIQRPASAT